MLTRGFGPRSQYAEYERPKVPNAAPPPLIDSDTQLVHGLTRASQIWSGSYLPL